MDRSPIENNSRPTLRGTSTCFRGSPGGWKVPTTYPPYPLFILHRYLSSNFNGARRFTGKAEGIVFTPSKFDQVRQRIGPLKGAQGERREVEGFPQGFVEWRSLLLLVCLVMLRGKPLIMSIGSFPHKAETLIIFTPHSLSRCVRAQAPQGAQGEWLWCRGFGQGLENWFAGVCVVCVIYLPSWYVGCQMRL